MADINEIDLRILRQLDGRERLKLLLKEKGLSLQDFARKHNVWVQDVSACLGGTRECPEIREALALELGLSREQIDAEIGRRAA